MVEKKRRARMAVNFMLPTEHFEQIAKQAADQERSMAYVMREIVAAHLGKHKEH